MACHVGTSKYSRDAHKDRALQLHNIFVVAMYMEECFLYVCLKYFVLIIWWLTIFNKCIYVYLMLQMLVGHSLLSGKMVSIDSLLWLGLNDTPY